MALRTIRVVGDPVLTKKCREVKTLTPHLRQLIDDMFETMYHANGVGLAAPQVAMINPVIVEKDGSQTGEEGCLSLPGKSGVVTRPSHVIVECLNRDMEKVRIEGTELLARCMCHEIDHLDGHMYTEYVEGDLHDVQYEEEEQ